MKAHDERPDVRGRASTRDAATIRLRRVTRASIAGAAALGGVFAALAAGSTHPKKTGQPQVRSASTTAAAAAPAPALIPAHAGAGSETGSASPSPSPAAPAPASTPPVVVSGGS